MDSDVKSVISVISSSIGVKTFVHVSFYWSQQQLICAVQEVDLDDGLSGPHTNSNKWLFS